MKEIQVVIQKRRILSGEYAGFESFKEIECRNEEDVRKANNHKTCESYKIVCTHITKKYVPDDYDINFSID